MLETERLRLRRPTPADVDAAATLLTDPEVMQWLGGEPVPREAVPTVVQRWIDDWETYPCGKFIVERRDDGAFVGRVGLNFFDPATWERTPAAGAQPELGWGLARAHWGHGYATEAALVVREWFAAPRLISLIVPTNVRSQRVAERLGAWPTDTIDLAGDGPHIVWVHP